ncbi:MAG: ATP-binding protein [Endomicrobiales bacterium]
MHKENKTVQDHLPASRGPAPFPEQPGGSGAFSRHPAPAPRGGKRLAGAGAPCSRTLQDTAPSFKAYRSPTGSTNSAFIQTDTRGRVTFINELGRDLFRRLGHDTAGANIADVVFPRGQHRHGGLRRVSLYTAARAYFSGVRSHGCSDGRKLWISWNCTVLREENGRETGLLCTGSDITGHAKSRNKASRQVDGLTFLSASAMCFVEHSSLPDIYRFIGEQLQQLAGEAIVAVTSFNRQQRLLLVESLSAGEKDRRWLHELFGGAPEGRSFPLARGKERALLGKFLVKVKDLDELTAGNIPRSAGREGEAVREPGEIHVIPLVSQRELLGIVVLITHASCPFIQPTLVEAFINQASVALKHKRSEDGIKHAAEEWRSTFDSITDPLFITGGDGRVIRVNRACARFSDREPETLIGRNYRELFPYNDTPSFLPLDREALRLKAPMSYEIFNARHQRYFEISLTPVHAVGGEAAKIIHVVKDITEWKKAEDVLLRDRNSLKNIVRKKTEELLGARTELENARRLSDIGVLAATIAHEIRNPLAAIKTATYNIRRKSRNSALESHLAHIDKKVMESDQIIRNLLSYSRIKLPNYEWVQIVTLLNECIDSVAVKYSRGNTVFRTELDCRPDDLIEADPVHLKVLFGNLLDNACQSLPDRAGTVYLRACIRDGELAVSVEDTGIGIDPEDLQRISEPFFTRKSKGIGLGLTICHQIIHLHNGRITVASEKNKGTSVTVTLPLKRKAV